MILCWLNLIGIKSHVLSEYVWEGDLVDKKNNKHILKYKVIECQWIYKLVNMKLSPISNIKNEITKK